MTPEFKVLAWVLKRHYPENNPPETYQEAEATAKEVLGKLEREGLLERLAAEDDIWDAEMLLDAVTGLQIGRAHV